MKKYKTRKKKRSKKKKDGMMTRARQRGTPQQLQQLPVQVPRRQRTPVPRRQTIYCGNNRLNTNVVNGTAIIGTRHRCLQKGYGVGFNLPVDMDMLSPYEPISNEKIYCGNNDILPDTYDRFGSLPSCFQKGVGIGKKKRAERN